MVSRCSDPNDPDWPHYGGRGITVCEEWRSPSAFIDYLETTLGDPPEGWSMDRIDNNAGYRPGNIRWASHSQQQRNRRPFPIGVPLARRHDMTLH